MVTVPTWKNYTRPRPTADSNRISNSIQATRKCWKSTLPILSSRNCWSKFKTTMKTKKKSRTSSLSWLKLLWSMLDTLFKLLRNSVKNCSNKSPSMLESLKTQLLKKSILTLSKKKWKKLLKLMLEITRLETTTIKTRDRIIHKKIRKYFQILMKKTTYDTYLILSNYIYQNILCINKIQLL